METIYDIAALAETYEGAEVNNNHMTYRTTKALLTVEAIGDVLRVVITDTYDDGPLLRADLTCGLDVANAMIRAALPYAL